ncbi:MAG: septum formation inhibitor Maf [Firmicutes bacterium]|nr:septum formation inhibitor Maf [Bacillota bacterium]
MSKIILASASPRRGELLNRLGFDFTIVPSKIDEDRFQGLAPAEMVEKLAANKARKVAVLVEDTVVIAADTVVVLNDEVLGKPADEKEACAMLNKLQGEKHAVYTGIALYRTDDDKLLLDYDRTDVYMSSMTEQEILSYVKTGEPMDKAGSYGIQGLGSIFIERIDGSYFTVMGLPVHKLALMLKEFGIAVI